jgi:superfamily I DNA and/or RNA helicase
MWIPLLNANRVVFAGDHCQLPPTVKSYEAGLQGLGVTLFEKAIKNDELGVMLKTQYRMHQDIMNFSSKAFYHNNLRADESVREHLVFNGDKAIEYVDTAGCGYYEEQEPESKSTFNAEEAGFLIRHFNGWISETYENAVSDEIQGIGIISSYKAQVNLLGKMMEEDESIPQEIKKITSINTIDSFQGQERDVIYISLARSNERSEIGFLSDIRRMNVAMTRARKKLVIIGDSGTIGLNEFYASLLDYVNEKDAYRSAFEWLT